MAISVRAPEGGLAAVPALTTAFVVPAFNEADNILRLFSDLEQHPGLFGGRAGGWPAAFAANVGEVRGIEFVPITFEVGGDLASWRVEVPGRVVGRAEALSGPTTPPGKRVQTINPPGSEVGPGQMATWGRSLEARTQGFAWT